MRKNKNIKRIITVILSFIFVFQICFDNAPIVFANGVGDSPNNNPEDTTPPTIESLSFGNSIEDDFLVGAVDDISGACRGTLFLRSVETGDVVSADFSKTYHDDDHDADIEYEDGELHGKLPNSVLNAGIFAIDKIQIWDNAGNSGEYYGKGNPNFDKYPDNNRLKESIARITVEVVEEKKDKEAPQIESLSIEKTVLGRWDESSVSAILTDDSEIKECSIGFQAVEGTYSEEEYNYAIDNQISASSYNFGVDCKILQKDSNGKVSAEGDFVISEMILSGKYVVCGVRLCDQYGNRHSYERDELPQEIQELEIEVCEGRNWRIKTIEFKQKEVRASEDLICEMEYYEPKGANASFSFYFVNQETHSTLSLNNARIISKSGKESEKGTYTSWKVELSYKIDSNIERGVYKIDDIIDCDIHADYWARIPGGNTPEQFLMPEELDDITFEIKSDTERDIEAPKIESLSIEKTVLGRWDESSVSAILTDDSEIKECIIGFGAVEGTYSEEEYNYANECQISASSTGIGVDCKISQKDSNGKVSAEGDFVISEIVISGKYVVNWVHLCDQYGNRHSYGRDELSQEIQELEIEVCEGRNWRIKTIEFKQKEVKASEELICEMEYYEPKGANASFSFDFVNQETHSTLSLNNARVLSRSEEESEKGTYTSWKVELSYKIDSNIERGVYKINDIIDYDINANYWARIPGGDTPEQFLIPEELDDIIFEIKSDTERDIEAPKIESLSIEKTVLGRWDESSVSAILTDDSEIKECIIGFGAVEGTYSEEEYNYANENQISASSTGIGVDCKISQKDSNGKVSAEGDFVISEIVISGKYVVNWVHLCDQYGNRHSYGRDELSQEIQELEIEVCEGRNWRIKTIEFKQKEVRASEELICEMEYYEPKGANARFSIHFVNQETHSTLSLNNARVLSRSEKESEKGTYTSWKVELSYKIDSNIERGVYKINDIIDYDINADYWARIQGGNTPEQFLIPEELNDVSIKIKGLSIIRVSILDEKLIEKIHALENDEIMEIDYSESSNARKEIFSAIEGTQKEIIFVSDELKWRFEGKDINTNYIKDINLSANINIIDNEEEAIKKELQKLVGDKTALIVKFADNGQLPGKTTVKVHANKDIKDYLGKGLLQASFWDTNTNKLVDVKKNIRINNDDDIVFDIEHCSYYVITGQSQVKVEDEFDDIDGTEWYVPFIQFVFDNGIMTGKGNKFDPNGKIKREELTQIIYSHAGKPELQENEINPFNDVSSDKWYCNGIVWCYKNSVVNGVGNNRFGVGQNVTREDLVLMLYKYAQVCGMEFVNNIDEEAYKGYKDSDKVSKYAIKAMNWAITNGLISGKGASGAPKSELSLDPKGNATRAEGAAMIMRFMEE